MNQSLLQTFRESCIFLSEWPSIPNLASAKKSWCEETEIFLESDSDTQRAKES
jgi:hypothetical protein